MKYGNKKNRHPGRSFAVASASANAAACPPKPWRRRKISGYTGFQISWVRPALQNFARNDKTLLSKNNDITEKAQKNAPNELLNGKLVKTKKSEKRTRQKLTG
jgi:hypothetical protein